MIPVQQTKAGGPDVPLEERGDCVPACLASVLEVQLAEIGNHHHAADDWFASLQETVISFGYEIVEIDPANLGRPYLDPPTGHWIAAVPSRNLAIAQCGLCTGSGCPGCDYEGERPPGHVVVARGFEIVHDPSIGEHRYQPGTLVPFDKLRDGWSLVQLEPSAGKVQRLHDERDEIQRELSNARATITKLRRRLDPERLRDPRVVEIFEYWQAQCGHPKAKLTADRVAKISARLREGFTVDELKVAIDGAAGGAYVDPVSGVKFDDLELICRSGAKVKLFTDRAAATTPAGDLTRKLVA